MLCGYPQKLGQICCLSLLYIYINKIAYIVFIYYYYIYTTLYTYICLYLYILYIYHRNLAIEVIVVT